MRNELIPQQQTQMLLIKQFTSPATYQHQRSFLTEPIQKENIIVFNARILSPPVPWGFVSFPTLLLAGCCTGYTGLLFSGSLNGNQVGKSSLTG